MSTKQIILRKAHCAQKSFEFHLCELRRDIERGVPVTHLWVRVELLEELVEKTGGSIVTEHYRLHLCEVKKLVVLRDERQRLNRRRARLEVVTLDGEVDTGDDVCEFHARGGEGRCNYCEESGDE